MEFRNVFPRIDGSHKVLQEQRFVSDEEADAEGKKVQR